jgi:GNAT superfamily N-acetyltransferase
MEESDDIFLLYQPDAKEEPEDAIFATLQPDTDTRIYYYYDTTIPISTLARLYGQIFDQCQKGDFDWEYAKGLLLDKSVDNFFLFIAAGINPEEPQDGWFLKGFVIGEYMVKYGTILINLICSAPSRVTSRGLRGEGRNLMNAVEYFGLNLNPPAARIRLNSVKSAVPFYRKLGFVPVAIAGASPDDLAQPHKKTLVAKRKRSRTPRRPQSPRIDLTYFFGFG